VIDLQPLLAAAAPADLLPARRADEAQRVELPWTIVASVEVGLADPANEGAALLVLEDARRERFGVPAVVDHGRLRRALPGDGFTEGFLALLAAEGGCAGLSVDVFGDLAGLSGEESFDVDQTNELVVVGGRAVVKWYLHPTEAAQPAPARMAALALAGFEGTPRTHAIVRLSVPASSALVATVVDFVADSQDGWEWAVDNVRAFVRGESKDGRQWVHDVAVLVAEMHLALMGNGVDEASAQQVSDWLGVATDELAACQGLLSASVYEVARERLSAIGQCAGAMTIDAHGDLHIGQVLHVRETGRYFVVDFDGNPMLEPHQRAARQPAARDVAGMLASLDHVGRVVLHRTADLDEQQRQQVHTWIEDAQVTFLDGYHLALAQAGCADLLDDRLVLPFQVQQELREYAYAERYLPHWRYVPDAALPALLSRSHA
jgi:maltokinase